MSLRVRKALVFICVIILLLSFQFFVPSLTRQNNDQIRAQEGGKDLQITRPQAKSHVLGDPLLQIESKKQVSPESAVSPVTPGDSIFRYDDRDHHIIDEQYATILIDGYPSNYIVTTVDVQYDIWHEAPEQLAVYIRVDGVTDTVIYPLFIGGPTDTTNDVHGSERFIGAFEGKEVNQEWHLWVVDRVYDGKEGYIDYWSITVRYNYRLEGTVKYRNQEDNSDSLLRKVKVVLHEDSPSGPVLDSTFTDDDGKYVMDYAPVDGDIYPVVSFLHPPIADIRDYDDISAGPVTAPPDFGADAGTPNIDLLIWKTEISLPAAHIWDYIITERDWMREHTMDSTTGRQDIIKCFIDFDEFTATSRYWFHPYGMDSLIFTHYKFPEWSWARMIVFHEYAHAIFVETYQYGVYLDIIVSEHYANTVSKPGFAFFEGWAEFMSCIIPEEDPTRIEHGGGNIETNEWWKGPDGNNQDGSVTRTGL